MAIKFVLDPRLPLNARGASMLKRVAEVVAARLGIADYKATVFITMKRSDDPDEGGSMGPIDDKAVKLDNGKLRCNKYAVMLDFGYFKSIGGERGTSRMFAVLAHELVHLKQWLLGELSMDTGKRQLFYMNCPVNKDQLAYEDQPWEQEAYKMMDDLAFEAVRRLASGTPSS